MSPSYLRESVANGDSQSVSSRGSGKKKYIGPRAPAEVCNEPVPGFPAEVPVGLTCLLLVLSSADATVALRRFEGEGSRPDLTGDWVKGTWQKTAVCRGGFADIHFLEHRSTVYAVKVIRDKIDNNSLLNERDALQELAKTYSSTHAAETHIIQLADQMFAVDGISLSALILHPVGRALSTVPAIEINILSLVRDMMTALGCLHMCNMVHCDVRPSNIIKVPDGYILIDLGMASAIGNTRTATQGVPSFVHDEVLLIDAAKYYRVAPFHDYTSLAYSVIAVVYGSGGGCCPWACASEEPEVTKECRDEWFNGWPQRDDTTRCRELVELLLLTSRRSEECDLNSHKLLLCAECLQMRMEDIRVGVPDDNYKSLPTSFPELKL